MANNSNTEKFIQKARVVHGDRYDYSKVEYIDFKTPVCIICPIHGEFWQKPFIHLSNHGCKKCRNEENGNRSRYTLSDFIEKARKIHSNKYDYSKVNYINTDEKVCIICPIHGEFEQTPHIHLKGCGCQKCGIDNQIEKQSFTTEQFIEKSKLIHKDLYSYDNTVYVSYHSKLYVTCPIHGDYLILPSRHLNGCGCQKCKVFSKLENILEENLKLFNIDFIKQYKFNEWKCAPYDFYIPSLKLVIECQGKQHFGKGGWSKNFDFEKQYEVDKKKYELCLNKGINIIYYTNYNLKEEYFGTIFKDINKLMDYVNYLLLTK